MRDGGLGCVGGTVKGLRCTPTHQSNRQTGRPGNIYISKRCDHKGTQLSPAALPQVSSASTPSRGQTLSVPLDTCSKMRAVAALSSTLLLALLLGTQYAQACVNLMGESPDSLVSLPYHVDCFTQQRVRALARELAASQRLAVPGLCQQLTCRRLT
jgi:hypothetical protein